MNPLTIESAIKTAFAASAFTGTDIYTGTDYEPLTPESLNLIVSVADIEHTVGALYKATLTVRVMAPALLGSSALSDFTTALNSVRNALEASYLSTNWPSGSPYFNGVFIQSTKSSKDKHEWVAEVQALIGVSE